MANNVYQGQIRGPFSANTNLFALIKADAAINMNFITHLGICTDVDIKRTFQINGSLVEIGKTGIYELTNAKITSLINNEKLDSNTFIDYTIAAY